MKCFLSGFEILQSGNFGGWNEKIIGFDIGGNGKGV